MMQSLLHNPLRLRRACNLFVGCLPALLALCGARWASANAVSDWNATLETVEKASGNGFGARSGAILHVAIYDAVNGITGKYAPYHAPDAPPHAGDPEAAADQAAYTVLLALFPTERQTIEERLQRSLHAIGGGPANRERIARGRAWGKRVAQAILAWRAGDGFDAVTPPFRGSSQTGKWRPTPPNERRAAMTPQLARLHPFAMRTPSQFRPPPPPALDSPTYLRDLKEVRELGGRNSKRRTAGQTEIARFDSDDIEIHWNRIARSFVKPGDDLLETARLFALLNIALADAGIFSFDAKYAYNFWRPITAIRRIDPRWTPLLPTPPHPDYVSRHCACAGAATTILIHFYGDRTPFTDRSDALNGVKRSYGSFSELCRETIEARTLAGVHFRTANLAGDQGGKKVAAYVLATLMPRR